MTGTTGHGFTQATAMQAGTHHEDPEILIKQAELESKAAALAGEAAGSAQSGKDDPEMTKAFQSRAEEIFTEAQGQGISLQSFKSPDDLVQQATKAGALDANGRPDSDARDSFLTGVQGGHDSFMEHAATNGASTEFLAAAEAMHQRFMEDCAKMDADFQARVAEMKAASAKSLEGVGVTDDAAPESPATNPEPNMDTPEPKGISGGGDVLRGLVAKFQAEQGGVNLPKFESCMGSLAMPEGGPPSVPSAAKSAPALSGGRTGRS